MLVTRPALTVTQVLPEHVAWLQAQQGLTVTPSMEGFTLWDADGPVCSAGISSPWAGLGMAWLLVRDPWVVQARSVTLLRRLRTEWEAMVARQAYRRIEARLVQGDVHGERLLGWLGFRVLAHKPGWGPQGETMTEYVWLPGGAA